MKPPTLWHYTTQGGALGIFNKGVLWASDIRFLNDSQEYERSVGMVRDLIRSRLVAELRPLEREYLQRVGDALVTGGLTDSTI